MFGQQLSVYYGEYIYSAKVKGKNFFFLNKKHHNKFISTEKYTNSKSLDTSTYVFFLFFYKSLLLSPVQIATENIYEQDRWSHY